MTTVSVIIPTYRRPLIVRRAVQSVLAQTYSSLEVIVVIDGTDDGTRSVVDALQDARTRVFETGINRGPAAARNFGVQQAVGGFITILDDDDEWAPIKLERQMAFVQEHNLSPDKEFLLSCRTVGRNVVSGKINIMPAILYRYGDDLSEYLMDRRRPLNRPGFVGTGTLLFPRTLALRVPFPNDRVHEDWSWLLICGGRDRIPLYMCAEAVFIYHLDPASRNTLTNWRESIEWGRNYRCYISGRAFAGLLSSTTAWRAKRQVGIRALPEIARTMFREATPTTMHWLMLLAVMLFPADIAERLRQRSL